MLAEDDAEPVNLESPKTKEIISTEETKRPSIVHPEHHNAQVAPKYQYLGQKNDLLTPVVGTMAIVPSKKHAGGSSLQKKLFLRRKKGNRKKRSFSFST